MSARYGYPTMAKRFWNRVGEEQPARNAVEKIFLAGRRMCRSRVLALAALPRSARHLVHRRLSGACRDPAAPPGSVGAGHRHRLQRDSRLRQHRARPYRAQGFAAVRVAVLVHHLRAVAQYRRLGAVGRGDPLPGLRDQGTVGSRDRRAGGDVLVHLRHRHAPGRQRAVHLLPGPGDALRARAAGRGVERQPA